MKIPDSEKMISEIAATKVVEEDYLKKVLTFVLLRARLIYGYTEILHYIFRCVCFRKRPKHLSEEPTLHRRHHIYHRGNQKLERELDIINIVKSIRQLRLMAQILLSPSERMLLKF